MTWRLYGEQRNLNINRGLSESAQNALLYGWIMKCKHCTEGKVLPAIPNPNMKKLLDCDYCNGTGEYEPNQDWIQKGSLLKSIRMNKRISITKFCRENGLSAIEVSKVERGIKLPSNVILIAYQAV